MVANPPPPPGSDESSTRSLAVGAHVSSILFPVLGPAVAIALTWSRPYAKFHAIRALLGDLRLLAITITITLISLASTIINLVNLLRNGGEVDWIGMIFKGVAVWLILALFGLVNTISSILDAIQASKGGYWGGKKWIDRRARTWVLGTSALPGSQEVS